jgi:uroporphyrinogen decarboxylase
MMVGESAVWHELQEKLVTLCVEYLVAQAEAGCESLQIFDSWLGYVGPREYDTFVVPYLMKLITQVKARVDVPVVFFATGVSALFPRLGKLPADAFGVDWRISLPEAAAAIGRSVPLQGNLDPQILAAPWEYIEGAARAVLDEGRELPAHIFNLGHGVLQHTPVENVQRLIELVKGYRR